MNLQASIFAALGLSISIAACGSDPDPQGMGGGATTTSSSTSTSTSTVTTTTGTGGSGMTRTPKVHREAEVACTEPRPPGGGGFGSPNDKCKMDAECTQGTNGRCVAALGQPTFCSYDECATDMDCGSVTVCECRSSPSYQANTCIHGTCRLDADCAFGYCSPSGVSLDAGCLFGIGQGSIGYFCHLPEDECVDDADCAGPMESMCLFDVTKKHWACHPLLCAG